MQTLNYLKPEKTIISIAHQLSMITHYDQLIMLKNGKIINSGTPANLPVSKRMYD